ncbi:MAG: hypothetical protein H6709_01850 [Kofleriaceae bacterium]|nr:hypothetical protein [Kofleriaceae bacterium]
MRTRSVWILGVLAVSVWWCAGGDAPRRPGATHVAPPQLAVRAGGFVALDGPAGARRVVAIDRDGHAAAPVRLALPAESRAIGASDHVGVVWRDGARIAVAGVDDGALGEPYHFGTRVERMCDGTASNDRRWGVGWRERDGRVWIVFGPTFRDGAGVADATATARVATAPAATATDLTWCAVASGDDQIVLFWRERGGDLSMNFCDRKRCSPLAPRLPPAISRATLLAVGCLRKGCGFVTRDRDDAIRLRWVVADSGRLKWTTTLPGARADTTATLVGAGDRQLALAYVAADGAHVARVDAKGALTELWHGADATAPALMWSQGQLLLAHAGAGAGDLATTVIALPR